MGKEDKTLSDIPVGTAAVREDAVSKSEYILQRILTDKTLVKRPLPDDVARNIATIGKRETGLLLKMLIKMNPDIEAFAAKLCLDNLLVYLDSF